MHLKGRKSFDGHISEMRRWGEETHQGEKQRGEEIN